MRRALPIIVGLVFSLLNANAMETPTMKISVMRNGEIFADGARIELSELKSALAKLSAAHGSVIYYREDPEAADPPANAMAVVQAIVEARLPVSLSSEPDFSTVVLPDGTIKPRE